MKKRIWNFVRRYVVRRSELDLAIAHRDAARNVTKRIQQEYLELESKMFKESGYAAAEVKVSIDDTSFTEDRPFCWRISCQISREQFVALRKRVESDLLPYIADVFRREILGQLKKRWEEKISQR